MSKKRYPVNPLAESQIFPAASDREFFLIHGYTGSPTDFNTLAKRLHQHFNATVKVLRLPGHGTNIRELDHLQYKDFIHYVEAELEKDLRQGKRIVIGGVSFGAQLALILAARHPVVGVFHVCIPYKMRFPLNLEILGGLKIFRKDWKKNYAHEELALRKNASYYDHMHIHGLTLAHQTNRQVDKHLKKITVPTLMIHSMKDSIGHFRALDILRAKIPAQVIETIVFDYEVKNHNIFYSPVFEQVSQKIVDFFETNQVFEKANVAGKVAAIAPVYNESANATGILKAWI